MVTTKVDSRKNMLKRNDQWANAIRELFTRHNLSLRGAEARGHHTVTRSYLSEWMRGKVPQYSTAVEFLEHFPRDEAIECLKAAGYPIPEAWQEELVHARPEHEQEPVSGASEDEIYAPKNVIAHLRKQGKLSEKSIAQIEELLRTTEEAHRKGIPHD